MGMETIYFSRPWALGFQPPGPEHTHPMLPQPLPPVRDQDGMRPLPSIKLEVPCPVFFGLGPVYNPVVGTGEATVRHFLDFTPPQKKKEEEKREDLHEGEAKSLQQHEPNVHWDFLNQPPSPLQSTCSGKPTPLFAFISSHHCRGSGCAARSTVFQGTGSCFGLIQARQARLSGEYGQLMEACQLQL